MRDERAALFPFRPLPVAGTNGESATTYPWPVLKGSYGWVWPTPQGPDAPRKPFDKWDEDFDLSLIRDEDLLRDE